MRLLNSKERKLEEFFDDQLPEYAILSHTWGADEVVYSDVVRDQNLLKDDGNPWTGKIRDSCKKAADEGFLYIWIDTVCIDKSSSAELSEAINSMYAWYGKAKRCYAYLADVPTEVDINSKESVFAKSRWFTRGWTLQELIAPQDVVFYSQDWVKLGEKSSNDENSLHDIISSITRIDSTVLQGLRDLESMSLAKRMSWASTRRTTRIEDRAYCLMGLFNVNMPMLYGEGEKAFIRLQEEIMKESDDRKPSPLFEKLHTIRSPSHSNHSLASLRGHILIGIPQIQRLSSPGSIPVLLKHTADCLLDLQRTLLILEVLSDMESQST